MKVQYKNIKKRNGKKGRVGLPTRSYFGLWKNLYHDVAVNPQNLTEIGAAGY
jgi:hypothetical protein